MPYWITLTACLIMCGLITYTAKDLITVLNGLNRQQLRLNSDVYQCMKHLGIERKSHRACRGGLKRKSTTAISTAGKNKPILKNNDIGDLLHMCVLNAQSVCNKADILQDYFVENDLDIVAFTETWLTENDTESKTIGDLKPDGFDFKHIPRPDRRGGGVALLYRDTIKCKVHTPYRAESFESMICDLISGSCKFKLVVVYRPQLSSSKKSTTAKFFQEFPDFVDSLVVGSGEFIIVGDFNFSWDIPDDSSTIRLKTCLDTHDLMQHVAEPTHISGHTLDLVMTRSSSNIVVSVCVKSFLSDHAAVHCELQGQKPRNPRTKLTYRKFKGVDKTAFANDIKNSRLITNPAESLCDLTDQYFSVLVGILDQHAPKKTRTITLKPSVPWINDEIMTEKKKRRQLERVWRRTKCSLDRDRFKEQRGQVNNLIIKSKTDFFLSKITECGQDQKALYRVVNQLLHKRNTPKLPEYDSLQEMLESFSEYFVTKIQTIRTKLDNETPMNLVHTGQRASSATMCNFKEASIMEVKKIISSSPSKSCDLDPIPTWMLKDHLDLLAPVITKMVNLSLTTSTVTPSMKHALVTPLLKKPSLDHQILKNFRPVSNLPFVSKVLEKVVAQQLLEHMNKNALNEPLQSAYRQVHSTETALLRVQNDLLRAMDNRQGVILVLLDLSAAFDTIDHDVLFLAWNTVLAFLVLLYSGFNLI